MPLDHTYYPHLLDQIIAQAPPASLLRLSHCSRALRDRIIPLLYGHVTLRAAPRNRGQVHAPTWPFQPLRILQGWRDEEPQHLSHTRVLDLCAAYFYGRADAFPNLQVIRHALAYRTWPWPRFAPHDRPRRVHLVKEEGERMGKKEEKEEWLQPHNWEPVTEGVYVAYLHLTEPRWHEEHDVPGLFIDVPGGTRRLVLHLAWDPKYPRVRFADITFAEMLMYSDIVVVFEPVRQAETETNPISCASQGSRRTRTRISSTPSDSDTYFDPMRDGMFGNLCYTLMNQVLDDGVAVCFVGVEQCTPAELFLESPPSGTPHAPAPGNSEDDDPHKTVSAARDKLREVLDSVLLMPEDYGWNCYPAWESMSAAEGDKFSGLLSDGLAKHFRFETLAQWRQGRGETEGGRLAELRELESTSIGWEEHEQRIMRSSNSETTRTFTRRP